MKKALFIIFSILAIGASIEKSKIQSIENYCLDVISETEFYENNYNKSDFSLYLTYRFENLINQFNN